MVNIIDSSRVLIVAGNTYPVEKIGSDLRFNVIPLGWEWADFSLTIFEMIEQELKGRRPGLRFWVISDPKAVSLLKSMQRHGSWGADAKFKKMIKIVNTLAIIEPHFMYFFDRHKDEPVNIRDVEVRLKNFLLSREWAQLPITRAEKLNEIQAKATLLAGETDGPEMLVLRGNMFSIDDFGSSCFFNLLPIPWTQGEFQRAVTDILQQELGWHERLTAAADAPYDFGADMLLQPLGLQIWRVSDSKPSSVLHYIHLSSKETGLLGARAKWGLGFIDSLSSRDPDFTYLFDNANIHIKEVLPRLQTWLSNHIERTSNFRS